jgi:hypothetical protein
VTTPHDASSDLATMAALGFGPEASLMTEPKLFVDGRLLSALIVELEDELGYPAAARTLFLVGLTHGLRDADRAVSHGFLSLDERRSGPDGDLSVRTAIPMDLEAPAARPTGLEVHGCWPAHHEADAWLAKLGPAEEASCWLSAGYTSGWLSGTLDADVLVLEDQCVGCGDGRCRFVAREIAGWDAAGPCPARELLGPIDFELFRAVALRTPSAAPELIETEGEFDPDAPLVHIWGPVMILPYTGPDDILRTCDALSRDPATREIAVVVLDLRGELLDEGFGAAAIERVLATIEAWAAEPILTGVAPLSLPVVESLESGHLVVRKDLEEAIAAAFLISHAQRYAA